MPTAFAVLLCHAAAWTLALARRRILPGHQQHPGGLYSRATHRLPFCRYFCAASVLPYWAAQSAGAWELFAGIFEFVPLVGPLLVAIMVAVHVILRWGFHGLPGAALPGVLRIVQDYVVYPRLIGQGIHLHPLAVIIAILAGAEISRRRRNLSGDSGNRDSDGELSPLAGASRQRKIGGSLNRRRQLANPTTSTHEPLTEHPTSTIRLRTRWRRHDQT